MFIDILKMISTNNAKYDTIKISKISIHDNSVVNIFVNQNTKLAPRYNHLVTCTPTTYIIIVSTKFTVSQLNLKHE